MALAKKSNSDYRFYATVMLVKRVFVELIGDFASDGRRSAGGMRGDMHPPPNKFRCYSPPALGR